MKGRRHVSVPAFWRVFLYEEVNPVDIGEVERIIEIEPLYSPVPGVHPAPIPIEPPVREPEPAR